MGRPRFLAECGLTAVLVVGCASQQPSSPASPPVTAAVATVAPVASGAAAVPPTARTQVSPAPTATPRPTPSPQPSDEVAAWLKVLETPGAQGRVQAVEFLAESADARVQPALEQAVADEVLAVRTAVVIALGMRGEQTAVKPVAAALRKELPESPDSEFVPAAATALGQLGGADGVPVLIEVLVASKGPGRTAAARAIGSIGPRALPALREALVDPDVDTRVAAVTGLAALGRDGVKPLIRALKDKAVEVRTSAANKLGYVGDRSAEQGLIALFANPERKTASIALARLYEREPLALTHYLESRKTLLVYHGLIYIGAEETVDALAKSLLSVGDLDMATELLNCGNDELEAAAERWASANGYVVVPGVGAKDDTWGSGLPD